MVFGFEQKSIRVIVLIIIAIIITNRFYCGSGTVVNTVQVLKTCIKPFN